MTLDEVAMSAGVAAIVSFVINLITWWIPARLVKPQLQFSPKISMRRTIDSDGYPGSLKYRVKVHNVGRRAVIDAQTHALIRFASRTDPENIQVVVIGVQSTPLPRLESDKGRTMNFKTEQIPSHQRRHFSPATQAELGQGTRVDLRDILAECGTEAHIRMWISCYDEYSGARRVFTSPDYTANDFTTSGFEPNSADIASGGPI